MLQAATSEAIAASKKLGVSSTHASKSKTGLAHWAKRWAGLLPALFMWENSKEGKVWDDRECLPTRYWNTNQRRCQVRTRERIGQLQL